MLKFIALMFNIDLKNTSLIDLINTYRGNKPLFNKIYQNKTNRNHTFEYYKLKFSNEELSEFDIVKSTRLNMKDKSSLIAEKNIK